ncbi:MAG: WD40 repeat domain-containing protein, partial [Armatimonadetes bacterium]|nr:WD40 repeat domain-containing protein [Armatimonadota bacterium]
MRCWIAVVLLSTAAHAQGGLVIPGQTAADRPELVVGAEPLEPLRAMCFSPDGSLLAARSEDGTVRVWDGATLQPRDEPIRGVDVTSLAISPDGSTLALGVEQGGFWLYDRASHKAVAGLRHAEGVPVDLVLFSPDGRTIASAGLLDRVITVRLWDVATRRPRGGPLVGHTANVMCLAFSPDSRLLATGAADSTVRLWEVPTGRPHGRPLSGHVQWVGAVSFSPDGLTLASHGCQDGKLVLWDLATGRPRLQAEPRNIGQEVQLAFSPDGALVTAADADTVCIWETATGKLRAAVDGHERPDPGQYMAVSPDGRSLAGLSWDQTVRLWDA